MRCSLLLLRWSRLASKLCSPFHILNSQCSYRQCVVELTWQVWNFVRDFYFSCSLTLSTSTFSVHFQFTVRHKAPISSFRWNFVCSIFFSLSSERWWKYKEKSLLKIHFVTNIHTHTLLLHATFHSLILTAVSTRYRMISWWNAASFVCLFTFFFIFFSALCKWVSK